MRYEDAITALATATNWHKASFSQGQENGCVEVGSVTDVVGVRDTKLGAESPILAFTSAAWHSFIDDVKAR
ncbi:DUF397 domain-containing protein [Kibdelosporangium philippinense]|uniref:DUF397 domain-containing protein n=1 Tax=Kibdelosporangium philippinense TaxID=211113 RepID=A0ABS8ZTU3_9PSEU|nr:DUF397 domain-containing protein [Kibdelosporangium philippinense]MCE7010031.1 DUF397 domain-containing protein [Kibdelosporangium philippinense]